MTVYIEGIDMKNQNDPARKDDKRTWSAPKVERRSMIDRTQGGSQIGIIETNGYSSS
jgi:hypothetical protein